jgi:hypothetical protein
VTIPLFAFLYHGAQSNTIMMMTHINKNVMKTEGTYMLTYMFHVVCVCCVMAER